MALFKAFRLKDYQADKKAWQKIRAYLKKEG
jgi:hypothetical protein